MSKFGSRNAAVSQTATHQLSTKYKKHFVLFHACADVQRPRLLTFQNRDRRTDEQTERRTDKTQNTALDRPNDKKKHKNTADEGTT